MKMLNVCIGQSVHTCLKIDNGCSFSLSIICRYQSKTRTFEREKEQYVYWTYISRYCTDLSGVYWSLVPCTSPFKQARIYGVVLHNTYARMSI